MRSTRAPLDAMLEEYRALTDRIDRLRDDLLSLTATDYSVDQCAGVTVNALGELIRLEFDPSIARRLDPPTLAKRVEEAAQRAASEMRRQKQAVMSELLPPGLRHLVDADLGTLLGEEAATGRLGPRPSRSAGQSR